MSWQSLHDDVGLVLVDEGAVDTWHRKRSLLSKKLHRGTFSEVNVYTGLHNEALGKEKTVSIISRET